MTLSDLRIRKFEADVDRWDLDGNGVVERSDFELAARRIAERVGADPSGAEAGRLLDAYRRIWDSWWAGADRDNDGRVTRQEYVDGLRQFVGSAGAEQVEAGARELIAVVFDALDIDSDGAIGRREYEAFVEAQGGDVEAVGEVWPTLDADGDGRLTRDEFVRLVAEYYNSDDPDAVGNAAFGPPPGSPGRRE